MIIDREGWGMGIRAWGVTHGGGERERLNDGWGERPARKEGDWDLLHT